MKPLDLTGQRFGRLVVLKQAPNKTGGVFWECKCDCGKTTFVLGKHLTTGNTKSCGCLRGENLEEMHFKHGLSGTRLYRIWIAMKQRCYYVSNINYKYYGGRGICVCDEWLSNPEAFAEWALSHGYEGTLTIDRIDPNKDYTPQNCRWISIQEQQRNRRPRLCKS